MMRLNGKAEILRHLRSTTGRGWSWRQLKEHGAPVFRDRDHPQIVWAYAEDLRAWSLRRGILICGPIKSP